LNPLVDNTGTQERRSKCVKRHFRLQRVLFLCLVLLFLPGTSLGVSKVSQGTGAWNAITWAPTGIPAPGDDVTIRAGDTVTLTTVSSALKSLTVNGSLVVGQTLNINNTATASLLINSGGVVTIGNSTAARTVDVNGDLTIANGGTLTAGASSATHTLTIGGNLTNNGTFDCLPGATRIINVTFDGAANQTVSGTGATTRFNNITISNTGPAGSDIVEVSSSNFAASAGFLTLTNGNFKVSGNFTLTNRFFSAANYTIGPGNQLWLNNPNVTVTAQGGAGLDAILSGTLRISAGTYNIGTTDTEGLEYNTGAVLQIDGGTLNFASRFRGVAATNTLTFNMSGGTISVNTVSNTSSRPSFAIESAGSSFTMSGGTIVFPHANVGNGTSNGGDYQNNAGTVNITGGTLQFGNAATLAGTDSAFNLGDSATNVAPSITLVDNATSAPVVTLGTPLTVYGDVTINPGTTLAAGTQALTVTGNSATNPGSWSNSGSFTHGAQTTTFNGSFGEQVIGGSAATAFGSLTIANTGSARTNMTTSGSVATTLTLTSNLFVTGSAVLTATGSTSTGNGDVVGTVTRTDNDGTARSFGNVNVQITRTAGTNTTFSVNYDNQSPTDFANAVRRTYTLTPGAAITATVRLRYLDTALELNGNTEAQLRLWRKNGSWASQGGTVDTVNNYVTLTGVTSFSPWAIAGATGATAVKLTRFSAKGYADGVALAWESGFEVNNLGYHLYREDNGKRTRVTPSIVAGSALTVGPGSRLTAGYSYSWFDRKGTPNSIYYLEAIDLNGEREFTAPLTVQNPGGVSPKQKRALLLTDLSLASSSLIVFERSWPSTLKKGERSKPSVESLESQQAIAARPAVKLSVKQTGWYRVSLAELFGAGLATNVDARMLQLFVDGAEVPIKLSTESAQLSGSDTLEFYAVALDTPTTDTHVYWLVQGESAGKRIGNPKRVKVKPGDPIWSDSSSGVRSFSYTVERRDKLIYFSNLLNGEDDNLFGPLVGTEAASQSLNVLNMDRAGGNSPQVEVALQGITSGSHEVQVTLNGTAIGNISYADRQHPIEHFTVDKALIRDGENIVSLVNSGSESDVSFVDWVRVTYSHKYSADNNSLGFSLSGTQQVRVGGFNTPNVRVVDITDPSAVLEVPTVAGPVGSEYGVRVQGRGIEPRTFMAFADDNVLHPAAIVANQPSTWNASSNGADMLIVTHKNFRQAIEPLASLRRNQGLNVAVVDIDDVYDEFSYGEHTPVALKSFLSWAASHWSRKPQYVLFAGDSTWDPRNYTGQGDNDFVPSKLLDTTFMETASDDWLADFDGDGVADMSIGRLPVSSVSQANTVVAKILSYEAELELQTQMRGALFVADTGFEWQTKQAELLLPAGMAVNTINRSEINNDETTRSEIMNGLNGGPLVVNYFGHGSVQVWTGADLLDNDQVGSLANGNRLSLYVMMTCLNGYAHDPYAESLGEAALTAQNGGAFAVWASTGFTEPQPQVTLNNEFYRQLFGVQPQRLGDAIRNAKLAVGDLDVRRTWILLGDPAMKIR
jgi:hypothetical protein